MNCNKETYAYSDNYDKPMLGPIDDDLQDLASNNGPDYDSNYDKEVNQLLDEVAKNILHEKSNPPTEKDTRDNNGHDDPKREEQYDDCFDHFPHDMQHHVGSIPSWYQEMCLKKKMKETRSRLEKLSSSCRFTCASTGAHSKRMEQDHSTVFCKMEFPRHPPLDKPWTNFWKFNCVTTCLDTDKQNHAHTAHCTSVLLQHVNTGVTTMTQNVSPNDFPKFVMDAVKLFQDFATETTKTVPFLDSKEASDTVYEKPTWTEMRLRSNYKNELMIIVRGKGVTRLITELRRYFDSGPGKTSKVTSVFCIDQKWSQRKSTFLPSYVTGSFTLRDEIGPIKIYYDQTNYMAFNSVQAIQIGKVIQDYAALTDQTTLLDISCNYGVLSLILSQKCYRILGLHTINFVSSKISQAEGLKEFHKIRNVSFIGCDPNDVLLKCEATLKGRTTVAVLNLATPYGKSIRVMQALRDLPSVSKVIVYGSFTNEYHSHIDILTCKDQFMGEHFLPMRCCILDKSPSAENAFDIVILFQRKSLMAPNPLASGPIVNIKPNSAIDESSALDAQQVQPILKLKKGFGKSDFGRKNNGSKLFTKFRGPLNKFGQFDIPMIPMDKEQPEMPKEKSRERAPLPTTTTKRRKFDCSLLGQKPTLSLPPPALAAAGAKKVLDRPVYPLIRKELQFKDFRRIYDSPSLPMPKEEKPFAASRRARSPRTRSFDFSVLKKEKQFDSLVSKREKPFDSLVLRNRQELLRQSRDQQQPPPLRPPFLSVEKELSCPTPPRERYPSPPPPPPPPPSPTDCPPTGFSMLDSSQIKKEEDLVLDAPVAAVKTPEPMQLHKDKEGGEESPEDCDRFPQVPIKSQQIDPSYFVGFSKVSPKQMTVKTEPADTHQSVGIENEPEDMLVSPNSEDMENMVTPLHNPRALDRKSAPLVASTNVKTTLDGFEFSVRANQSFLSSKCDALQQAYAGARVKKEFADKELVDTEEEIEIIDEKSVGQPRKLQSKDSEPRITLTSLDEIIKEKSEMEQRDDLSTLIEQRKTLQRKLERQKELHYYYKEFHGRSPTPGLPRKYRQQSSPSPPPSFRKYRSPSPRERKYVPSPSPYSSRHRSPVNRKYSKSPPSPAGWIKRERSPASPARWTKRERSPASPVRWIKRDRSPSIGWTTRSPSPNARRRNRSPPSPNGRHRRRSPLSPIRFKREPYSPPRFKREPVSPASSKWSERSTRSPSSSPSYKTYYGVSKSPVRSRRDNRKQRSRSRSPIEIKRKRRSFSPVTLSPSPPRKQRNDSQERDTLKKKKKKSKLKSKTKSRSSSRTLKKKHKTASSASGNATTTAKDETHWDIPGLSALSSPWQNSSQHGKKSNVEATTASVRIDATKKKKNVSRDTRSERSSSPLSNRNIKFDARKTINFRQAS